MNRTRLCFALVPLLVYLPSGATAEEHGTSEKIRAEEALRTALEQPEEPSALAGALSVLPRDGRLYIVEGDLRLSEREVRDYYRARKAQASHASNALPAGSELAVNMLGDHEDYWKEVEQRRLTYAIDSKSFGRSKEGVAQYERVKKALKTAAADWEAACEECGLKFEHLAQHDTTPSHRHVTFIVRRWNSGGRFLAAAFYPHDPPERRYVDIDPTFFTTPHPPEGVMRHELGHVLGYRHEQVQGVTGCYPEDGTWKPLTDYEPRSVMHYLCGDGGTRTLQLTDADRTGHRKLYGRPEDLEKKKPEATPSELLIRVEGGDVSSVIPLIVRRLNAGGAIQYRAHTVSPGETICSIYKERAKLPGGCTQELTLLATELNPGIEINRLQPGQTVLYPTVDLESYTFLRSSRQPDKSASVAYERVWPFLLQNKHESPEETEYYLKGYSLQLPFPSKEAANQAVQGVTDLLSRNVQFEVVEKSPNERPFYASVTLAQLWNQCAIDHLPRNTEAEVEQLLIPGGVRMQALSGGKALAPSKQAHIALLESQIAPHPELRSVIGSGAPWDPATPLPNPACSDTFFTSSHHGASMAGLIAAAKDDLGIAGVDPLVPIHFVDFSKGKHQKDVASAITQLNKDNPKNMLIFAVASDWDFEPPYTTDSSGTYLKDPVYRFSSSALSRMVSNPQRHLWVVAAGQQKPDSPYLPPLNASIARGPQNLGDNPNVLVVTGCAPCEPSNSSIWKDAVVSDDSRGFVHVAAPSQEIISLSGNGGYARSSGTSLSSALVAGLASKMVWHYPDYYYGVPERLKQRLTLTATPLSDSYQMMQLVGGVVDAERALLDPSTTWLKLRGENYEPIELLHWCSRDIELNDIITDNVLPEGKQNFQDVYRIVRHSPLSSTQGAFWVYFEREYQLRGITQYARGLLVSGPGRISTKAVPEERLALIRRKNNDSVMVLEANHLEDLILASSVTTIKPGHCERTTGLPNVQSGVP